MTCTLKVLTLTMWAERRLILCVSHLEKTRKALRRLTKVNLQRVKVIIEHHNNRDNDCYLTPQAIGFSHHCSDTTQSDYISLLLQ